MWSDRGVSKPKCELGNRFDVKDLIEHMGVEGVVLFDKSGCCYLEKVRSNFSLSS